MICFLPGPSGWFREMSREVLSKEENGGELTERIRECGIYQIGWRRGTECPVHSIVSIKTAKNTNKNFSLCMSSQIP
jgi:hypothetical protein